MLPVDPVVSVESGEPVLAKHVRILIFPHANSFTCAENQLSSAIDECHRPAAITSFCRRLPFRHHGYLGCSDVGVLHMTLPLCQPPHILKFLDKSTTYGPSFQRERSRRCRVSLAPGAAWTLRHFSSRYRHFGVCVLARRLGGGAAPIPSAISSRERRGRRCRRNHREWSMRSKTVARESVKRESE